MLRCVESENLLDPRFLQLYDVSFPPNEKIPPVLLSRTIGKGGKMRYFYDSDLFVGFCLTFEYGGISFVVYLAVSPTLRGEGYGSDILDHVSSEENLRGMFLTAEVTEGEGDDLRQRHDRRRFYRRNGWKPTGIRVPGKIDMEVYVLDSDIPRDDILRTRERFYDVIDGRP
jgi:GNAT superfamily N-acetyltransferase